MRRSWLIVGWVKVAARAGGRSYGWLFGVGLGLIAAGFVLGVTRAASVARGLPSLEQTPLAEAEAWLARGQAERAAREYRHAALLSPGDFAVLTHVGQGLLRAGDATGSAAAWRGARRLRRDSPEPLIGLGWTLYRLGRLEEARAAYQEALRIDARSARAHAGLGELWLEQDRFDLARAEFETSLQLSPADAEVLNSLGITLALSGRHSEAVAQFEAALRIKPETEIRANLERARAAVERGRPSPQLPELRQLRQ